MVPCRSLDSVHATTLRCFASGKNTVHLLLLPCPSLLLVYYEQQLDPREIRETMRTQLGLPASFHLYLCPQAIFKFHPAFDDMLVSVFPTKATVSCTDDGIGPSLPKGERHLGQ